MWRETLSGWGDFRVGKIDRLVEKGDQVIVFNRLTNRADGLEAAGLRE